jgi:hypothetical protein
MDDWRKQRDLLIEETMVFAQRVRINAPKQFEFPKTVGQPVAKGVATKSEPLQLPRSTEVPTSNGERDLIQRRLANFSALQKKFQQEREEYYTRTMSDARATQWIPRSRINGAQIPN